MSDRPTSSTEQLDAGMPGAFPDGGSDAGATSTQLSLSHALYARRAEYTQPRNVRIKIGSWNVAASKGTEHDLSGWFVGGKGVEESLAGLGVSGPKSESKEPRESVAEQESRRVSVAPTIPHNDDGAIPGHEEVDLYVLGLQEIVDVSSPAEALRPYTDPSVANKWKATLEAALPPGFQLVAEQQLIGLLLIIYASPTLHPHVKHVSTTSVGTGLMGYMGNKGAVTARIVVGETTRLVFINSHLGAGADKTSLERRNWDAAQIMSRTKFDAVPDTIGLSQGQAEGIGEEDFAFWFGDLNYRLEGMPGDDVRRLLTVHTRDMDRQSPIDPDNPETPVDQNSTSNDSSDKTEDAIPLPPELDPASLQTTLDSLLPHDELRQQQKAGKAFHDGWREGPILFLPTYKYDVGKVGVFDSSEKRRCPSWCDRILYRTIAARMRYEADTQEKEAAKKRDDEMKAKGLDQAGTEEDVLYDYDPDTDGDGDNNDSYDDYDESADVLTEVVTTKEGFTDEITLDYYATHMRVLSSDHKPLNAVFALKYDAILPDLKASIHQEVARELDRQENEGRPSITVVFDRPAKSSSPDDENKDDSTFEGVDFGDVHFAKTKRRSVTIANTGKVPATFGFTDRPVPADQPQGPFPTWLTVTVDKDPEKVGKQLQDSLLARYTLEPAEVCNIELKLKLDLLESVKNLNEETAFLDEILVLRVLDGRDHFLPIRGRWLQSSLARTVDKLIKIPEGGIRKLQGQKPSSSDGVKWSVPRELFRLTDAIEDLTERSLADWEMTGNDPEKAPWQHNASWPFANDESEDEAFGDMTANVVDSLDCDAPFDDAFYPGTSAQTRTEILGSTLLLFLSSLQDGIITKSLWEKIEEGITTHEKARTTLPTDDERMWILETLASTPSHNSSFLLLTSMLQNLSNSLAAVAKSTESRPRSRSTRSSVEIPSSPKVSVRRKTLSRVPEVAVKQVICKNYAAVFAEALIRASGREAARQKERAQRRERMVRVMELFLSDGLEVGPAA